MKVKKSFTNIIRKALDPLQIQIKSFLLQKFLVSELLFINLEQSETPAIVLQREGFTSNERYKKIKLVIGRSLLYGKTEEIVIQSLIEKSSFIGLTLPPLNSQDMNIIMRCLANKKELFALSLDICLRENPDRNILNLENEFLQIVKTLNIHTFILEIESLMQEITALQKSRFQEIIGQVITNPNIKKLIIYDSMAMNLKNTNIMVALIKDIASERIEISTEFPILYGKYRGDIVEITATDKLNISVNNTLIRDNVEPQLPKSPNISRLLVQREIGLNK